MDQDRIDRMRTLLSIHMAVIAVLTAMLVSTGSGSIFLPLFIFIVSATSIVVVDSLGWVALNRWGIFIGMTAGTGIAIGNYIYSTLYVPSESGQLHAVAGLLVYPEAVLFWQRKNLRVFEQLAIFLLLEIMVAALVNDNILFGLMLMPIVLMWVSSLMLFSTYATLVQIAPGIEVPMPKLAELLFARLRTSIMGTERRRPILQSKLIVNRAVDGPVNSQRAPQSITLGVGAIAFAAMFFYLLPRTTTGGYRPRLGTQIVVGLPNDKLQLGQIGRALQDPTPVLRMKLTTGKDRRPYTLREAPYIRYKVFDRYSRDSEFDATFSTWYPPEGRLSFHPIQDFSILGEDAKNGRDRVDVEFDLLPATTADSFLMPPACLPSAGYPPDRRIESYSQILRNQSQRDDEEERHTKAYRVGSTAFVGGRQLDIYPVLPSGDSEALSRMLQRHWNTLTSVNNSLIPSVDKLRQRILEQSNVPPENRLGIAKAIEEFFLSGKEYTYTLNLRHDNKQIDPIEDFVANIKAGHCQYFAATMVFMLRQSEIPARIVVGYHPHQQNQFGDYLRVLQKDAHAWVEARFRASELVGTEYEKWTTPGSDYWIRFDPTPDISEELVEQPGGLQDFAERLWKGYVLEGRELTGENSVYAPVAQSSTETYKDLAQQWQQWKDALTSGNFGQGGNSIHFAWPLAIATFVLGAGAIALWQLFRSLPRFAPKLAKRLGIRERKSDFKQEFFSKLVRLIGRLGIERQNSQTPKEITEHAANVLTTNDNSNANRDWLELLTSYYYRLRFGSSNNLNEQEQRDVQTALRNLEKSVAQAQRLQSKA